MLPVQKKYEYVIAGAGVVGLCIARELLTRGARHILIVEKEDGIGRHASGRNSGVLHAGIYYSSDSLKAKLCVEGHRSWMRFAREHGVPLLECGKVIVATKPETVATLETLKQRARANGVPVEELTLDQLRDLEPEAHSHEKALWSPNTTIIDSKRALEALYAQLQEAGVEIQLNSRLDSVDTDRRIANLGFEGRTRRQVAYEFLINCAGAYADQVAHMFGVGLNYRILPFKGLYWKSSPAFACRIRHLIYPAPDLKMPFLGVHVTRTITRDVLFGPTAIPAFGRENYSLLKNLDWRETPSILWRLAQMTVRNPSNFRSYVREEMLRYLPSEFYREVKTLVPRLTRAEIGGFAKVGIRAQLMDIDKKSLEMDFVLKPGPSSFHILNAVSPAFTSAPAFARYVADRLHAGAGGEVKPVNEVSSLLT